MFIGIVGYYRHLIFHFAKLNKPLVRFLMKDTPSQWEEQEQESLFRALIRALATSPILVHPDYDKSFILFINASDVAIVAILAQHDLKRVYHPISYYRGPISREERNYSAFKRECLVVSCHQVLLTFPIWHKL